MSTPSATLIIQKGSDAVPNRPFFVREAFRFHMASASSPRGFHFDGIVSFSVSPEGEVDGTLQVSRLRGITIAERNEIMETEAFIQLEASLGGGTETTIFFGEIQDFTYQLVGGSLEWEIAATFNPGRVFDVEVKRNFRGTRTIREVYEGLRQAVGLSGTILGGDLGGIKVQDWVANGKQSAEISRLLQHGYEVLKALGVSSPKLVPTQESTAAGLRLDLIPEGFFAFTPINLDSFGVLAAGPYTESGGEPEELDGAEQLEQKQDYFSITVDFNPDITLGGSMTATSEENSIGVGFPVRQVKHKVGTAWTTEFSGPVLSGGVFGA